MTGLWSHFPPHSTPLSAQLRRTRSGLALGLQTSSPPCTPSPLWSTLSRAPVLGRWRSAAHRGTTLAARTGPGPGRWAAGGTSRPGGRAEEKSGSPDGGGQEVGKSHAVFRAGRKGGLPRKPGRRPWPGGEAWPAALGRDPRLPHTASGLSPQAPCPCPSPTATPSPPSPLTRTTSSVASWTPTKSSVQFRVASRSSAPPRSTRSRWRKYSGASPRPSVSTLRCWAECCGGEACAARPPRPRPGPHCACAGPRRRRTSRRGPPFAGQERGGAKAWDGVGGAGGGARRSAPAFSAPPRAGVGTGARPGGGGRALAGPSGSSRPARRARAARSAVSSVPAAAAAGRRAAAFYLLAHTLLALENFLPGSSLFFTSV